MKRKRSAAAQAALELIQSMKTETSTYMNESYISPNQDKLDAEKAMYENSHAYKVKKAANERSEFIRNLKSYMVESWLNDLFTKSLGNRASVISEDTAMLNKSIVKQFVNEEGVDNLLSYMETKSDMLSTVARYINETVEDTVEDIDDFSNPTVDKDLEKDMFDNLTGSEEFEDVSDIIHSRVSQATQNFIQKNMVDKLDIKELMNNTKEKIENIRTGDAETDEAIRQEQTIKMKRTIKSINNRPHSVFEQLVINLTEAVLKNEDTKKKFTNESGRLNMDAIVERCTSLYTMLEIVNTLQLKDMDAAYIESVIKMD